jgi:uracil-DNA glycosylase family 4
MSYGGSGSRKSKIMIVGEAPGAREDETHKAFVGPAGALLTELLSEAGISRDECYITNIAKCRPPENRTPDSKNSRSVETLTSSKNLRKYNQVTFYFSVTPHRDQLPVVRYH